jgi:aminomethyltransferase
MRHSPLHALHERLGARFTGFAGWDMPLSYAGTRAEHEAVRASAGLFDLCHMGRLHLSGPGALILLHRATPSDLESLAPGHCRYTVVLNAEGGIVDDIIVTRLAPESFHVCVNASRREAVLNHLRGHGSDLPVEVKDRSAATAQIAVQGPATDRVIAPLLSGPFPAYMTTARGAWNHAPVTVSRTGYTGELGVELFLPVESAAGLWEALREHAEPCGLGARDTLRLEAGYPLYGNELSETVSPVEAGIGWVVAWDRDDLPGAGRLHKDRDTPGRRLCGFTVEGGIPRQGCAVYADERPVGELTSGNMGLSVGTGVALGYLSAALAVDGTAVGIEVRGRRLPGKVTRPPFYREGTVRRAVGEG